MDARTQLYQRNFVFLVLEAKRYQTRKYKHCGCELCSGARVGAQYCKQQQNRKYQFWGFGMLSSCIWNAFEMFLRKLVLFVLDTKRYQTRKYQLFGFDLFLKSTNSPQNTKRYQTRKYQLLRLSCIRDAFELYSRCFRVVFEKVGTFCFRHETLPNQNVPTCWVWVVFGARVDAQYCKQQQNWKYQLLRSSCIRYAFELYSKCFRVVFEKVCSSVRGMEVACKTKASGYGSRVLTARVRIQLHALAANVHEVTCVVTPPANARIARLRLHASSHLCNHSRTARSHSRSTC